MQIKTDVSLKDYSTMRLGGPAKALTTVHTEQELLEALAWADQHQLPAIMIGDGSNIIWRDEGFAGLVIVDGIMGYHEEQTPDGSYLITAGAGENWDDFIAKVAAKGLSGIENLSLIPGTVGATPVQNVGAYGQEISETMAHLTAYDTQQKKMTTVPVADCALDYRTSRFKTKDHGRFFITSVTFHLQKRDPRPPFYASLQQYLVGHNITTYTPQVIRDAVIAIRQAKLPDPAKVANNGSFFANPIIPRIQFSDLLVQNPHIAHWPVGKDNVKISAAWLVQEAGFKNMHDAATGMATWPTQALVLVNEHAPNTAALLAFKQKIVDAVHQKFGITLAQEPEIL